MQKHVLQTRVDGLRGDARAPDLVDARRQSTRIEARDMQRRAERHDLFDPRLAAQAPGQRDEIRPANGPRMQPMAPDEILRLALREQHKTEFMAEETARHFLSHKSYTDRSFDTLQQHLGGFEADELRKILVRAGAIRLIRDDGSEWWRLLSRMDEYIEKKRQSAD